MPEAFQFLRLPPHRCWRADVLHVVGLDGAARQFAERDLGVAQAHLARDGRAAAQRSADREIGIVARRDEAAIGVDAVLDGHPQIGIQVGVERNRSAGGRRALAAGLAGERHDADDIAADAGAALRVPYRELPRGIADDALGQRKFAVDGRLGQRSSDAEIKGEIALGPQAALREPVIEQPAAGLALQLHVDGGAGEIGLAVSGDGQIGSAISLQGYGDRLAGNGAIGRGGHRLHPKPLQRRCREACCGKLVLALERLDAALECRIA